MINRDKNSLFHGLKKSQVDRFLQLAEQVHVDKNTKIINEGMYEPFFYYIIEGTLRIVKNSGIKEHEIASLGEGESVGEMVLIDNEPRSASVISDTPCTLYRFDLGKLMAVPELSQVIKRLRKNIHQKIASRFRLTNKVTLQALINKYIMSVFFMRLVILLAMYTLSLNLIEKSKIFVSNTTLLSAGLIIIFAVVLGAIIKKSGYPYSFYGLTLENSLSDCREAVVFTLPLLAIIVLIKWLAINFVPSLHQYPLFDITASFESSLDFTWTGYFIFMFMYALFCPIQQFVVRGCVQSPLQFLLEGTAQSVKWKAIFVSNILFASVHSHTSFGFAVFSFIPGIFWGWLYARQRSLVGVSLSHIMLGVWAVFIVGFENMVR